jgi:hypothetical protein
MKQNKICKLSYTYFGVSVRLSVCSRLAFYWKELRSCNMAQNVRVLPDQIISYLTFFFFCFKFFFGGVLFLLKNC